MASDRDIVVEARELFKDASPRPWLVEIHDARGDYAKIALVTRNGYFQTGYYVIADDDMECRREQAIADFKAISRAPELLRALADEVERLRKGKVRYFKCVSCVGCGRDSWHRKDTKKD